MATAPGFRETLRAMERTNFRHGAAIQVPVTISVGSRDLVLLPVIARRRTELPKQAQWHTLAGCGHIPMFDHPDSVAAFIQASTTDPVNLQSALT
jgi:pimeloyl-ACP methyl ester carboxylesterase